MLTTSITSFTIPNGLNYQDYRQLVSILLAEGKVTGEKQSAARLEFTKLNIQRMNRLDKTIGLITSLAINAATIKQKQIWLLLAQGWCGDCAQIIPVVAKIVSLAEPEIDLRIINPDEHPEIMNAYLTNGSRSVPKLIVFDKETKTELCTWGPRPLPAQQLMLNWKNNNNGVSWNEFEKELHTWYARDKTFTTQQELLNLPIWHSSK